MPKRTNAFQRFVHDLEALLAPHGATVEESGMVLDRSTGKKVEVDVVIKIPGGSRTMVIGVECRDQKRPVSIKWIDELNSRKQNLQIDRLVAVSRSGFTKTAEEKAKLFGIETEKMAANRLVRWLSSFAFLRYIIVQENVAPFCDAVRVRFLDESDFRALTQEEFSTAFVYGSEGDKIGSLAEVGNGIAQFPVVARFTEYQLQNTKDHHLVKCQLKPGFKLELQGGLHSLVEIEFRVRVIQHSRSIPFEHFDYQNAQGIHAEFDVFNQGRMQLVLAQSEGDEPKLLLKRNESKPDQS